MTALLVVLQAVHVVFLWTRDWIPLGRMNGTAAIRRQACWSRTQRAPGWLWNWLWISYGLLFAGELSAWWMPYLVRPQPERAARYRVLYGCTHAFLPARNGIVPNTLHCLLHLATLAMLLTLAVEPPVPR